jgi:uridine phosphorylase
VVTVVKFPIGAPATVAMMEEMIACGMRTLITTGAAGSLQEHAPIGTIVVPTSAIREEGTSHHYAPHDVPARPQPDVVAAVTAQLDSQGVSYLKGDNWTTDAIYREHRGKIDLYRRAGVLTVDMELSALWTVGAIRGVRCGAVVAVSDELHGDTWEIGFGSDTMQRGVTQAARIALDAALSLAAKEA